MKQKSIAIIPARGGSKRILKKNIKHFLGKPIIEYSINAALESKLFDRILVSTDDEDIAKLSTELGAEVPFIRPKQFSDDFTTTSDVIQHCIEWLEINSEKSYDAFCCIYATAPFIRPTDLIESHEIFKSGKWDYVFPATAYSYPIQRSFKKRVDGSIEMNYPEHFSSRSQDLSKTYYDSGQFYWGRKQAWLEKRKIFSNNSAIIELPSYRVQDIDTIEDWERAELLYKLLKENRL